MRIRILPQTMPQMCVFPRRRAARRAADRGGGLCGYFGGAASDPGCPSAPSLLHLTAPGRVQQGERGAAGPPAAAGAGGGAAAAAAAPPCCLVISWLWKDSRESLLSSAFVCFDVSREGRLCCSSRTDSRLCQRSSHVFVAAMLVSLQLFPKRAAVPGAAGPSSGSGPGHGPSSAPGSC